MTNINELKKLQVIILAAGQGTRMRSHLPKPLVSVLGQPLLEYVSNAVTQFSTQQDISTSLGVVVGHKRELVEEFLSSKEESFEIAYQKEQNGTAHAVTCFFEAHPEAWHSDFVLIASGDTPTLDSKDLSAMYQELIASDCDGVCASFLTENPFGFGRIIREGKGFKIVEEKDANENEKLVKEVNAGLYLLKTNFIKKYLNEIKSENKASEFYLTDLFNSDRSVIAKLFQQAENFLGVNDLAQLSLAETILQRKKVNKLQCEGVRFIHPESSYIEWQVDIGEGSIVYPGVCLEGSSAIGLSCKIEAGVVLKDTTVESDTVILAHSYLEDSHIGASCQIGPFARIRPGSSFEDFVKVGNFVETKNTLLKSGAKVSHLSYVGDAEVGENSNLGCGLITCNYDGEKKHKTIIGSGTFIGSDCQLIAPITIGDDSFIAAGSTLTHDVPSGGFAIARSKQVTKEHMAKKFLKTKK